VFFPANLTVLVEQPRFSFIKRSEDLRVDFVSPVPCPFNYGSVPDSQAEDGDREDVVVLGPRLPKGLYQQLPVLARAHFYDAGRYDGKWVCGKAMRPLDRGALIAFFTVYARFKRVLNRARGLSGETRFAGLELAPKAVSE